MLFSNKKIQVAKEKLDLLEQFGADFEYYCGDQNYLIKDYLLDPNGLEFNLRKLKNYYDDLIKLVEIKGNKAQLLNDLLIRTPTVDKTKEIYALSAVDDDNLINMNDELIKSFDINAGKGVDDVENGNIVGFQDERNRLHRVVVILINSNLTAECFFIDKAKVLCVSPRELFKLNDNVSDLIKYPSLASKLKLYGIVLDPKCGTYYIDLINTILNTNHELKFKFKQHSNDGLCLYAEFDGDLVSLNAFLVLTKLAKANNKHIKLLVDNFNYVDLEKVCKISFARLDLIKAKAQELKA